MSAITLQEPIPASALPVGDDELYEIVDGKRKRTPPMAAFSVWIAFELARRICNFTMENLGWTATEMLYHLPAPINRDRRPDVAFVSYRRWPKNRRIPTDNAWNVVPNLAIEVVSPTDSAEELQQKINEYFQTGVELVWVVYPVQATIHIYQSGMPIKGVTIGDILDGGAVLPGFQLLLVELFGTDASSSNGSAGTN